MGRPDVWPCLVWGQILLIPIIQVSIVTESRQSTGIQSRTAPHPLANSVSQSAQQGSSQRSRKKGVAVDREGKATQTFEWFDCVASQEFIFRASNLIVCRCRCFRNSYTLYIIYLIRSLMDHDKAVLPTQCRTDFVLVRDNDREVPVGSYILLLGWRPSILGWRPSLVGWRPLLLRRSACKTVGSSSYGSAAKRIAT